MPSSYPGTLDTLPTNNQNETPSIDTHPALHNNANDAVNKIERELGTNPSGSYNTVGARLDARPVGVPMSGDVGAAINSAIQASQAAGGGRVELSKGIGTVETPIILRSGVYVVGEGEEATILRGKSGTTHDLVKTFNFDSLVGLNINDGVYNWGLESLTLDGNAAARPASTSRGIAIYGKAFRLMHFIIRNTPGVGLFSEWYNGGDEMECQIAHFKIWRSRGHGFHFRGPHDSVIQDGQVIAAGYGGAADIKGIFADSGAAAGTQWMGIHSWGLEHAKAWHVTTNGSQLIGCQGEGAQDMQLHLDAQDVVIMGGHYFGIGAPDDDSTALVVGDVTTAAYPARCMIMTKLSGSARPTDFQREGGRNMFKLSVAPKNEGDQIVNGMPHPSSSLELNVDSEANTADNYKQGSGPVKYYLPYTDNAINLVRYIEGGDEDGLIEIDTQGEPTAKFKNFWYEAVTVDEGGETPAWEISPDGAAIFTKAKPITLQNGSIGVTELDGAAPGEANRAILYARDNGSGKTRLLAQFPTGSPVQVAIEP